MVSPIISIVPKSGPLRIEIVTGPVNTSLSNIGSSKELALLIIMVSLTDSRTALPIRTYPFPAELFGYGAGFGLVG
jgi:uncharacterized membrane protein